MSWSLLANSLGVTAAATLGALMLGAPVALAFQLASVPARRLLLIASLAVLALPSFFVAGMWMQLVGFAGAWRAGEGPWVTRWLPMLMSALVLASLLWPIPALLLAGTWDRLDRRLLEACPLLGGLLLVRHVLWPAGRGAIGQAAALTAALALTNFAVPSLFQARIWPEAIWIEFSTRFDAGAALRASWPLFGVALGLAALALRRPTVWPNRVGAVPAWLLRERLGRLMTRTPMLAAALVMVVSGGLPLGLAFANRRTWIELLPAVAAAAPALGRSLLYALGGTALALTLGFGLSRWRWPVLLAPLFFLPGIFEGIALLRLTEHAPFDALRASPLLVILALALRYAFLGWLVAGRLWRAVDRGCRDAIAIQGGGTLAVWRHAILPRGGSVIFAVGCIMHVLALWDVETLVLIVPPGGDSLALMIFNLLHYGHNPQVSALCVWLGVAAVLPPLAAWLAVRIGRSPRSLSAAGSVAFALLLAGCSPEPPANEARLESKLFDRVNVIGRRGTGPGFFLKPRSVAVDRDDNLFVVDMTGRVQKFDREGRYLLLWQMPETDKGKAKGMATASDGGILVVEPHYHRVNHFTPDGKLLGQWGVHGTNAGQFWFPRAIAVGTGNDCFVSEYGVVERVQRFSADGRQFLGFFGGEGTDPGQLSRAEGLGTDAAGDVVVADSCNHRIQVFSPEGRLLRVHGRAGQGPGEFSYPYDVRVDARGLQYVCEFGNSRVQILDDQDRTVEILGGPGSAPDRMNNPWSLCLDSRGNLYVADAMNHRVLKYHRRDTARRL